MPTGDRWLLHYDPEDEERKIIFTTDNHLRHLARARFWVMDGSFKPAPRVVCQIYAIHASVHGRWVPLVITLLERKTRRSYEELLDILKMEVWSLMRRDLSPMVIATDFEQAAIQASQAVFPDKNNGKLGAKKCILNVPPSR